MEYRRTDLHFKWNLYFNKYKLLGCTHIDTLNLIIGNSSSNSFSVSTWNSYTWNVNGQTYTTSSIYTSISTNSSGCTQTDSLILVINSSVTSSTNVSS